LRKDWHAPVAWTGGELDHEFTATSTAAATFLPNFAQPQPSRRRIS